MRARPHKLTIAYAEGLLHNFPVTLMRLQETQQELLYLRRTYDVQAQGYEISSKLGCGTHSDPVARRGDRIFTLEFLLKRLELRTVPVMRLRNEFKNSANEDDRAKYFIMELYYFEGMSLVDVMFHLQKGSIGYMRGQKRRLIDAVLQEAARFSNSL